jgi:subtilisin-like proprotein convertase family protein
MSKVSQITILLVQLFLSQAAAQLTIVENKYFKDVVDFSKSDERTINTRNSRAVEIDLIQLREQLSKIEKGIDVIFLELPFPDGTSHKFKISKNSTLHPDLAARFPGINTYDISGLDNPLEIGKLDITPLGFHVMINNPGYPTIFIDPYLLNNTSQHLVYFKNELIADENFSCEFNALPDEEFSSEHLRSGSCELRRYRLALAATGEYTTFHGGTKEKALAAQATTINRVNGIFESNLGITFQIIAANDKLIFTNASTDPFTNGDPQKMVYENQTTIHSIIGSSNYDIGHVFGTNSGGFAEFGVVCNDSKKARGATGRSSPQGDPFDVDYVAHEIGHQFGAHHTQNNNCQRNLNTAMEPGSGSTIMAYAGVCAPNVQSNSDAYFHAVSVQQIQNFIYSPGHTCPLMVSQNNSSPVILAATDNVTIPSLTPFALQVNATDADNDVLIYQWEQFNNEVSAQPPLNTSTLGPNFRSFQPSLKAVRYFPELKALTGGSSPTWEVLPSVSRTMKFRVLVRDHKMISGCSDFRDVSISTDANSGPFTIIHPNSNFVEWTGETEELVTWDVASTNLPPVNCQQVKILLSVDGGLSYPYVLLEQTANDGSEKIGVPNISTDKARIMVMADNGTFFNISNHDFPIVPPPLDFQLSVTDTFKLACQSESVEFEISITRLGGFNEAIELSVDGLPSGLSATFSENPLAANNGSTLVISGTAQIEPGNYIFSLIASNNSVGNKIQHLAIKVVLARPPDVVLFSPENNVTNIGFPATFKWYSSIPDVLYDIQVTIDPWFTNFVDEEINIADTVHISEKLTVNKTYYWRVRASNECGHSPYTAQKFSTQSCKVFASEDLPVEIPANGTPTIYSKIQVPLRGFVKDVNIHNVNGTHQRVKNLTISLMSPSGTRVTLLDEICTNSHTNLNIGFDDEAGSANFPCPPTDGSVYIPHQPLDIFNGENATGEWTLIIKDNVNLNGGFLQGWSLEICVDPPPCEDAEMPVIIGPSYICSGSHFELNVSSDNLNDATYWQWYTSDCGSVPIWVGSSLSIEADTVDNIFVRGEGGCTSPGPCAAYYLSILPNHKTEEFAEVCMGETYVFPDGSVGNSSEIHYSYFQNQFGCDSTILTNLQVIQVDSTLLLLENQLMAVQDNATYQWIDCNNFNEPIEEQTQQTFTIAAESGAYAVVINYNGCKVQTPCFSYQPGSMNALTNSPIHIFPNPFSDKLNIQFEEKENYLINLFNAFGVKMQVLISSEIGYAVIDLTELTSGIYFLTIQNDSSAKSFKIIKI